MATIIDSYSESNQDNQTSLGSGAAEVAGIGQSFTGDGSTLGSCKWYLKKSGSPTGNAVAKIYAHTGTFGTSSKPTGAALATSDTFDVSTLSTSFALTTLTFSGVNQIVLTAGTKYVISIEFSATTSPNIVIVGEDDSSPGHAGNPSTLFSGTWTAQTLWDECFYVYSIEPYTIEQEGYRFRNDDGSESSATWLASQDTAVTQPKLTNTRLRILLNATIDPAGQQYQLEYKKSTDSIYKKVQGAALGNGAIPTVYAVGASDTGAGAITPGIPAGTVAGDLLILYVLSENETISITSAGWTEVASSPQGTGTAGGATSTRLAVFWKVAGNDEQSPTVGDSGDHTFAYIVGVRGAPDGPNPINISSGSVEASADSTLVASGATTTVPNCLVLVACACDADTATPQFSNWANADLGSFGEVADAGSATGDGGVIGVASGTKAAAGAFGNSTADVATSTVKAFVTIAIKPKTVNEMGHTLVGTPVRFTGASGPLTQAYSNGTAATVMTLTLVVDGTVQRAGGAPTFNGVTMTQADQTRGGTTGYETSTELWYLLNPPSGSQTISIPNTGAKTIYAVASSFKAADGYTSALDTSTGAEATTGANPHPSITPTVNGAVIVGVMGNGQANAPTARFGTSIFSTDNGAFSDSHQYYLQNDAGALLFGWVVPTDDHAVCLAAFKCVDARPIVLSASSNIAAGGADTTFQLSAPSGKSTGDFTAGRIQDDENPADSVDIPADDYTEMEWCLQATALAVDDEIYQFRVTVNGTAIDTYTVTPEWTIGEVGGTETAGVSPVAITASVPSVTASARFIAAVAAVSILIAVPSASASYVQHEEAEVAPVSVEISASDVTAIPIHQAVAPPASVVVSVQTVTAGYFQVNSAGVAPATVTVVAPAVSAKNVATAVAANVGVEIAPVDVTAIYEAELIAAVAPVSIAVTVPTVSVQDVSVASASPVAVNVTVPSVSATHRSTSAVTPVPVTITVPTVTSEHDELAVAGAGIIVVQAIVPTVSAAYRVSANVAPAAVVVSTPACTATYIATAALAPGVVTVTVQNLTATHRSTASANPVALLTSIPGVSASHRSRASVLPSAVTVLIPDVLPTFVEDLPTHVVSLIGIVKDRAVISGSMADLSSLTGTAADRSPIYGTITNQSQLHGILDDSGGIIGSP